MKSHSYTKTSAAVDEYSLVQSMLSGNTASFDVLYERYFHRVYAFLAAHVKNRQDVEDLTSEVFLRFWRSAGSFRGDAQLGTWLLTIARNAVIDFRRKHGKYSVVSLNTALVDGDTEFVEHLPDDAEEPAALVARLEEYAETWQALERLASHHREVLEMRFVAEMSYEDISASLDVAVGTVKSRIFRALRSLRLLLNA